MNELKIFESSEFGVIRTLGTSDEPLFNANDICSALGYTNSWKAVADHVQEDDLTKREVIDSMGRKQMANYVNESGMYSLIFGSTKPEAKAFKHWVTSEVLPSIRKTGEYKTKKVASVNAVRSHYTAIEMKKNLLNLNDASVADLINKADVVLGIEGQQIDYVPSNGILRSITYILRTNGIDMTAHQANLKLVDKGVLRVCTRKSRGGKEKKFYNITEEGKIYGENKTCPQNPNETQPMWYENKSNDIINIIK